MVHFNPKWPVKPKVQGIRAPNGERFSRPSLEELDLAIYSEREITDVDGVDVRHFLASQQELSELANTSA